MTGINQPEILAEVDGTIGRITINRPAKRNAMTLEMWRNLGQVLEGWQSDPRIRVLILAGAGDKSFCAGNDIREYATIRATAEQRVAYDSITTRTYDLLKTFPRPTIARITGYCVGGGMELALLCDLQIAAASASFAVTPARLGIGYKLEDVKLLLENISPKHARELLYTADKFSAQTAERWGLISRAVPDSQLDEELAALASSIAANAPLTVAALKFTIAEARKNEPDRELCADLVKLCDASDDRREGQTAFAEKREPVFHGK
ncbi:MAG: enoyl-CoA hydratase [Rhodospirillales bacterium]